MKPISLSRAAAATGLKHRTLQFWADNGVIHAIPSEKSGTGVKRLYDVREIATAALLQKVVGISLPVGELREIAAEVRKIFNHKAARNGTEAELNWYRFEANEGREYYSFIKERDARRKSGTPDCDTLHVQEQEKVDAYYRELHSLYACRFFYEALEGTRAVACVLKRHANDRWRVDFTAASDLPYEGGIEAPKDWALLFAINATAAFAGLNKETAP